jgi:hypothetical protein
MDPKRRVRSITDPGSSASQPAEMIPQMPKTPQPRPASRLRQTNTPSRIPKRGIMNDSSVTDHGTLHGLGRLVVTNASIVSSSSSESEAEAPSSKLSTDHTSHLQTPFSLHDRSYLMESSDQHPGRGYGKPGNPSSHSIDQESKRGRISRMPLARGENSREAIVPVKLPVDLIPDSAPSQPASDTLIQERRRTALLGIFDGIDFNAGARPTSIAVTDSDRSLDRFQESVNLGLAISNSNDANEAIEDSAHYNYHYGLESHEQRAHNASSLRSHETTPKPPDYSHMGRRAHQDLPFPQSLSGINSLMPADVHVQTCNAAVGSLGSRSKQSLARACTSSAGTITSDTVTLVDESLSLAARERMALGIPPSVSDDLSGDIGSLGLSQANSNISLMSFGNNQEQAVDLSQGAEALFRKISLSKLEGSRASRAYDRHEITRRLVSSSASFSSNASSAPSIYDEDISDGLDDAQTDLKWDAYTDTYERPSPRLTTSMTSTVESGDTFSSPRHRLSRSHSVIAHERSEVSIEALGPNQAFKTPSTTLRRIARHHRSESHEAHHRRSRSGLSIHPRHDSVTTTNDLELGQSPSSESSSTNDDARYHGNITGGGTWASMLSSKEFDRVIQEYGKQEVERQEMIVSFIESEDAFVNKFQIIVRLFIQPLRVRGRKAWIEGIPSDICRLFDWLEDIINLHSQLLSTLRTIQIEQSPVIQNFSDPLRVFVPRLEVYQPYLARIDTVINSLNALIEQNDDFAKFVRLQETQNNNCEWRLLDVLSEPLDRLAMLTDYFEV